MIIDDQGFSRSYFWLLPHPLVSSVSSTGDAQD
jgi:hypothetical protein